MTETTARHNYEWAIYGGCRDLAVRLLGGSDAGCGFTALIDANGCIVYFQSNELPVCISEGLKCSYGVLYFDPFDGPVHTLISWENCALEMLEVSLNISLVSIDSEFVSSNKVVY